MKKILFSVLLLTLISFNAFSQNDETSCFNQWAKAFEVRGGDEVKDGWHDNVVLSIRHGSKTTCYSAKVQVEKNEIKDIFIKYVNGKYEPYLPKWKYEDQKALITNGISKTMQTIEDDLINIIFINHLKPKKTAYELAPLPNPDDF